MDASAHFRDKKITVMGLGLLGGVGDITYLAESGADIIATDLKSEEELRTSLDVLKKFPNIRYTLGRHDLADFRNRDLIIKAPSTPLDSPHIAEARKNGVPVTMWAALFATFAREAGTTIVGITGTRGKTTVTAMVTSILRAAGRNVVEGGNVQGTSLLPQLTNVSKETIVVLELDSWKLQGFGEAKMSPDIAVFTILYQDHLNYYKNDLDAYLADKANIFLYQKPEDTLILGKQCAPTVIEKYGEKIESKIVIAVRIFFGRSRKAKPKPTCALREGKGGRRTGQGRPSHRAGSWHGAGDSYQRRKAGGSEPQTCRVDHARIHSVYLREQACSERERDDDSFGTAVHHGSRNAQEGGRPPAAVSYHQTRILRCRVNPLGLARFFYCTCRSGGTCCVIIC